jgi:aspartate carbamoyltransferase
MGEEILEKEDYLRNAVTFKEEYLKELPDGVKFYHPLPRHREYPTIPTFLDPLSINGWDIQSQNGYFTRIIEIGMVGGKIGEDFNGSHPKLKEYPDDFVKSSETKGDKKADYKIGIKPVEEGIVIDHIELGKNVDIIWSHINKIRQVLNLNCIGSHGVFKSNRTGKHKGIVSLPTIKAFDEAQIKMLGAIAPGCTLNIIKDAKVLKKYRLHMPPRIYNFKEISCKNPKCISFPEHFEKVIPEFYRSESSTFVCKYCEKPHTFYDIWDISDI